MMNSIHCIVNDRDNYRIFRLFDDNIVNIVPTVPNGDEGEHIERDRKKPQSNNVNKKHACQVDIGGVSYQDYYYSTNNRQLELLDTWDGFGRSVQYVLLAKALVLTYVDAYHTSLVRCTLY